MWCSGLSWLLTLGVCVIYYYILLLYLIHILYILYYISYTILFSPYQSSPLLFHSSSFPYLSSPHPSSPNTHPSSSLPSISFHSIRVGTYLRLFIFSSDLSNNSKVLTPHVLSDGNVEWCSFNVCGVLVWVGCWR